MRYTYLAYLTAIPLIDDGAEGSHFFRQPQ